MGTYDPLTADLRDRVGGAANMRFADVAAMVGGLPASASTHRAWWANSTAGNSGHSPQDTGRAVDENFAVARHKRQRTDTPRARKLSFRDHLP